MFLAGQLKPSPNNSNAENGSSDDEAAVGDDGEEDLKPSEDKENKDGEEVEELGGGTVVDPVMGGETAYPCCSTRTTVKRAAARQAALSKDGHGCQNNNGEEKGKRKQRIKVAGNINCDKKKRKLADNNCEKRLKAVEPRFLFSMSLFSQYTSF